MCFVLALNKSELMPASTHGANVDNNSASVLSSQSASGVSRQVEPLDIDFPRCSVFPKAHDSAWKRSVQTAVSVAGQREYSVVVVDRSAAHSRSLWSGKSGHVVWPLLPVCLTYISVQRLNIYSRPLMTKLPD